MISDRGTNYNVGNIRIANIEIDLDWQERLQLIGPSIRVEEPNRKGIFRL